MTYVATLDADVLHPQIAADVLLRLSERGLFRPVWSNEILRELLDSLVERGLDRDRIERRIAMMQDAFPEALVDDISPFMATVPAGVDADDRHVVAAALAAKADAIVTNNLRHFPYESLAPLALDVQGLDGFLLNQWTLDSETVSGVFRELEEDRDRPPRTFDELMAALEGLAPEFVAAVQAEAVR
jgi:predicted nucleic acid-binding protein